MNVCMYNYVLYYYCGYYFAIVYIKHLRTYAINHLRYNKIDIGLILSWSDRIKSNRIGSDWVQFVPVRSGLLRSDVNLVGWI